MMIDPRSSSSYRLLARLRRGSVLVVVLVVFGLIATACGSGPASLGVANLGSASTTTTTPSAAGNSGGAFGNPQKSYQNLVSYAQCMRANGVPDFPDPTKSAHGIGLRAPANTSSPQFKSANNTCKHFLPNGGGPPTAAQIAALSARLLKYAQCMRTHGVPNFPDPSIQSGGQGFAVRLGGPGLDRNSPQFQSAQKSCRSLLPGFGP